MSRNGWKLLFISSHLLVVSCVNDNIMVRDYFKHKRVSSVVGFSCGSIESSLKLVKTFNDVYVHTSIWSLESVIELSSITLRKLLHSNYRNLGIYVDTRCDDQNYTVIYSEATKYLMYDETHKWLILGQNLNDTVRSLNDEAYGIVTDVTIAIPSLTGYELYDVYNPCKARGGSLNVTALGYWTEKSGVTIKLKQSVFERRSNLHGMKLKVGILLSYKYYNLSAEDIMLDQNMKARHGRFRFLYTLLSHMADLFNFTIEFVEVNPREQDNSAPMFVAFQKKIIDVSGSPIVMKAEKLKMGDIIGPVWPMRTCFLFRTISSAAMETDQFLQPLNVKVWYVILFMIVIATSVLVVLLRREGVPNIIKSYDISILLTLGAMSQQASVFVPVRYAGRIAFIHVMLFSVLIMNYYSASIVSDRLKNIGEKMNDSLISLADSNLKVAAERTPYIRSFLQSPEREVQYFATMRWDRVPESKRYLPLAEGLDQVSMGDLAYHTTIDSAYPYIERNFQTRMICELTEVHLFRAVLAFWARHKSPFTPLLRIGLTKMYNVGICKRQLKRWSSRKPFCPKNVLIAEPLSIYEAAPVFVFLNICAVLSFVLCVMENLVHWIWPTRSSISASGRRQSVVERSTSVVIDGVDKDVTQDEISPHE